MEIEKQKKSFKEEPVELSEEKLDEMLGLDHKENHPSRILAKLNSRVKK